MEKRTPHCKLVVVKALLAAGKVRARVSALAGGAALGFDFERDRRPGCRADPARLLQKHDHAHRSPYLAGCLPTEDIGRRCPSEAHGLAVAQGLDDVLIVSFKEL